MVGEGPRSAKGTIARRRFLRGAGGFTLALPLLPSLDTRAFGADPAIARAVRFAAFTTEHGGIAGPNMYPADAALDGRTTLFAGHEARHGLLSGVAQGANVALSRVLTAPATKLGARLVGKMNLLRGFDIPFYIGHHTGGHLGNFLRSDQGPKDLRAFPTIDQVMAHSPSFYRDLAGVKLRSIVAGVDFRGISWGHSNPAAKSGEIQKVAVEGDAAALFGRLFDGAGAPTPQPRRPIVDRVLDGYRRLRGHARLSALDRQRLDDHIGRLAELERRLATPAAAACGSLAPPEDSTRYNANRGVDSGRRFHGLLNDVIAAAFICGASRVATICVANHFTDFGGDWHEQVAHKGDQATLVEGLRNTFEHAVLDLAAKLDVDRGDGTSHLDDTLVQWTQESGRDTHDALGMPIVTFGSAGGFLRTGLYVDYRNRNPRSDDGPFSKEADPERGLLLRHYLATALQAVGVPRAEFEHEGRPGYGDPTVHAWYERCVVPEVLARQSDVVPLLKA